MRDVLANFPSYRRNSRQKSIKIFQRSNCSLFDILVFDSFLVTCKNMLSRLDYIFRKIYIFIRIEIEIEEKRYEFHDERQLIAIYQLIKLCNLSIYCMEEDRSNRVILLSKNEEQKFKFFQIESLPQYFSHNIFSKIFLNHPIEFFATDHTKKKIPDYTTIIYIIQQAAFKPENTKNCATIN